MYGTLETVECPCMLALLLRLRVDARKIWIALNKLLPPKLHWPAFTRSWLLVILPACPFWLSFFFFFFANRMGCRILILQPGIEPRPPAVKAWCPNHWTEGMISFLSRVEFTPVKHRVFGDFPGCWVVKTSCFQRRGTWIWSLVGELRSHNLCEVAKKKKKKNQTRILFSFYMQTQIQNNS